MKKIKNLIVTILLCVICLSLCSCSVTKKDIVGMWEREYTNKENVYTTVIELKEDGTYTQTISKNGVTGGTEKGTYDINGKKIRLCEDGNEGAYTEYKYRNGKLANIKHEFTKAK